MQQAELNPEQRLAVETTEGAVCVIAGPGAGKTRTLTSRYVYLVRDLGINPQNILCVTFTNKAAQEMKARIRAMTGDLDLGQICTFHAFCVRFLKDEGYVIGIPKDFIVIDEEDELELLNEVYETFGIPGNLMKFSAAMDVIGNFKDDSNYIRDLVLTSPESLREKALQSPDISDKVFYGYLWAERKIFGLDFDDVIWAAFYILDHFPSVKQKWQERLQYVMVDEYQDTNYLQSRLIDMLAREHGQLMVVGDDAQSIYSWRGADMENILSFTTRYPAAKTFKIETNYRSVPEILELSNAAIAANEVQIEKQLRSVRPTGEMPPALVPLNDDRIQAKFVVQRIRDLIEEGTDPSEIAVLYRAHFHSMELQMELTRGEIPFRITSGIRFFEQAHIKDVVAFMRFVVNPKDELSFRRMVMLLPGIGPGMAQKLWIRWTACPESRQETPPESFSALMLDFPVPAKSRTAWTQLCYTLDELAPAGKLAGPASMLLSINEAVYDEYMQAAFENYDQRRQDLLHLAGFSERFESTEDFLSQLSLLGNTDDESAAADFSGGSVTLSTIHQAKGLEWSVVFLIGLCDGMFPHQRVIDDGDLAGLEEERRLFYVGITRAKDQLYLTYPRWNCRAQGGTFMQMPSRFLDEFPAGLVEEWEVE